MAKKGSKYQKRTPEFKVEIVKRHLLEGVSVEILAKENQLEPRLIRTWRSLYVKDGEDGLKPKPKGRPKGSPAIGRPKKEYVSEMERLQHENARLKLEVARLKKLQEL
ncbi:transposase [Cohnella sp. CFH 77786]|uniref:transposase n=1 Tax=Cohnella sp. CFH 77786 TaxID=2662265 RepID=UPI001C60E694|nr:transposase [Cohnella sp. CFH 77786]